jgi:hydroxypyruvate reductase
MKTELQQDHNINFLKDMFDVAIEAAKPNFVALRDSFPIPPKGRLLVIGAGKASGLMAKSFEDAANLYWRPEDFAKIEGRVITRYGHGIACERIQVVEAAHPVPDDTGDKEANAMLSLLSDIKPDDHVICLFSGGGSALMSLPADGVSLNDKRDINRQLLASGANIHEMNCVRKHLSKVKGGRLLELCKGVRVTTYLVSDIPGDDPAIIASGPTLPDTTTCQNALEIIERYQITISDSIRGKLLNGDLETLKPSNPIFVQAAPPIVMSSSSDLLKAAQAYSQLKGIKAIILSDSLDGEAKEVGETIGQIAMQMSKLQNGHTGPMLLLSGGETTVTGCSSGRGGRNTEFLLSFANTINGKKGIYALSADSDGMDGSEVSAGAIYGPDTARQAKSARLSLLDALRQHNSAEFFEKIGSLIVSAPPEQM